MIETRKYTVSGLVQGVCYRRHAAEAATEIGIRGWVRNISGGKIELLAKGDQEQFNQLQLALWKGSPMSNVTEVVFDPAEDFTAEGFTINWAQPPN